MMRLAAAVTLLAALVRPGAASPCDGDRCTGDQTWQPWVLRRVCSDDTDVVGYRRCTSFGAWAAGPKLNFEAGVGLRRLSIPAAAGSGIARVNSEEPASTRDEIFTSIVRITGSEHGYHAGVELEAGDLDLSDRRYGAFLQSGAVLGMDARFGPLSVGGEAMVGGRNIERPVDVAHTEESSLTQPVLELRLRAELWLTPWITLGVGLGAGILERPETAGSLVLGFHTRAFGGPQ